MLLELNKVMRNMVRSWSGLWRYVCAVLAFMDNKFNLYFWMEFLHKHLHNFSFSSA